MARHRRSDPRPVLRELFDGLPWTLAAHTKKSLRADVYCSLRTDGRCGPHAAEHRIDLNNKRKHYIKKPEVTGAGAGFKGRAERRCIKQAFPPLKVSIRSSPRAVTRPLLRALNDGAVSVFMRSRRWLCDCGPPDKHAASRTINV
ncbi:hypothetical protein EVAR_51087_1 [Eumeta japonica]|uniref:Uncharacterized protein n=1 Tax=Eumeta variegata TaxID=151549 RepID=A0A4C1XPA6_EUMVA|nr:hypothetical protein EVAR_51087_1 [Eumeta japonica]